MSGGPTSGTPQESCVWISHLLKEGLKLVPGKYKVRFKAGIVEGTPIERHFIEVGHPQRVNKSGSIRFRESSLERSSSDRDNREPTSD